MSILIRGKEMPTSCAECPLYETIDWCELDWKTVFDAAESGERAEDCPLVEIKTPHGRLVDADALLKGRGDHEMISTHEIYNAPTIIESEE